MNQTVLKMIKMLILNARSVSAFTTDRCKQIATIFFAPNVSFNLF